MAENDSILIDTCGWIEWVTDGKQSNLYQRYFKNYQFIVTPTAIQYELYKWVAKNIDVQTALKVTAITEQTKVEPLSTAISLLAADLSMKYQLSFADAIIYATAEYKTVDLITSDSHFEGLPKVVFYRK